MIIYLGTYPEGDDIPSGGAMLKTSLWDYIRTRFMGSERIFTMGVRPEGGLIGSIIRRNLHFPVVLSKVFRSKNRVYLMLYPQFPFAPTQSRWALFRGLAFITMLKVLALVRRGTIIIHVHDFARFSEGSEYQEKIPPAGERLIKLFEYLSFRMADRMWASSDAMADFLTRDLGIRRGKFRTLINGNRRSVESVDKALHSDTVKFVYGGKLGRGTGTDDMIAAFLNVAIPTVELYLCGPGGEWIGERYGDERIKYLGVTPTIEYLFGVVKSCDVGIIPYPRQTYNDIEYPTKLALYITCEVPVLTNNLPTCSSVVLENNVGMSCSLEHMSSSMALLARNDELRAMFKENCRRVKEHFYWDRIFDDAFAPIIHKQPRCSG